MEIEPIFVTSCSPQRVDLNEYATFQSVINNAVYFSF
jgi:hypothetical protein